MNDNAQQEFLSHVKKEINQRINSETKALDSLNKENDELKEAILGYETFYKNLSHFIIESMQDFSCTEEDLPIYFKRNINDVYENYSQIRHDALTEIDTLNKYIKHCQKEIKSNEKTLKFYNSQYSDSDFFEECKPLVKLYHEKIDLYNLNIDCTNKTIEKLENIYKKLERWE